MYDVLIQIIILNFFFALFQFISLEQLEQLDMSYNKIKFIPNEISQLE